MHASDALVCFGGGSRESQSRSVRIDGQCGRVSDKSLASAGTQSLTCTHPQDMQSGKICMCGLLQHLQWPPMKFALDAMC